MTKAEEEKMAVMKMEEGNNHPEHSLFIVKDKA